MTVRVSVVAAAVAVVTLSILPTFPARAQEVSDATDMAVIAELPGPPHRADGAEYTACSPRRLATIRGGCNLLVEETMNIAFGKSGVGDAVFQADLARLQVTTPIVREDAFNDGQDERNYVLDRSRRRLYRVTSQPLVNTAAGLAPPNGLITVASNCHVGKARTRDFDILVLDYGPLAEGRSATQRVTVMPCADGATLVEPFVPAAGGGLEVHEESGAVYLSGLWGLEDHWRCLHTACGSAILPQFGQAMQDGSGQGLLVRQARLDDASGRWIVDWDIDLRATGCGRRKADITEFTPWVSRVGNVLVAYCWGHNATAVSTSPLGYVVRIPLETGADGVARPIAADGGALTRDPRGEVVNYAFSRIPTLPGVVTPIMDKVSGRLILATEGAVNGNAFWVFDVNGGRFVGVVAGGNARQPRNNTAVGFDADRGVAYLLTKDGILRGNVRTTPPSPGRLYPVLQNVGNKEGFVTDTVIGVAPDLRRLFIPVASPTPGPGERRRWYVVVEDRVEDPVPPHLPSPDSLTTDVEERDGKTESRAAGAAMASGVHFVGAGGLARAVGGADPVCHVEFDREGDGVPDIVLQPESTVVGPDQCLSEEILTPGHREASFAATTAEVATGNGAIGRAAGVAWGASDSATDADLRRVGDCLADAGDRPDGYARSSPRRWGKDDSGPFFDDGAQTGDDNPEFEAGWNSLQGGRDQFWSGLQPLRDGIYGSEEKPGPYRAACTGAGDGVAENGGPDLRDGKYGADGKGAPVPAAACSDFGAAPSADGRPGDAEFQRAVSAASTTCDLGVLKVEASASTHGVALPDGAAPQLAFGRTTSVARSLATADGQVTMAFAAVHGVQVGPLVIGEVRSLAITRARGRPGTTSSVLVRQWCRLSVEGAPDEIAGCIDPDSEETEKFLENLNQTAFQQKIRLTVPQSTMQATPKGYQAVVTKHPEERGGDQTVNDDDSLTVAALQAVFYNDGNQGRNRLVVQLAGVHAESRYGIIELPNFSGGEFPGGETGGGEPPSELPTGPVDVPPVPSPIETAFGAPTDTGAFEEIVFESVPEFERRLPAGPVQTIRRGGESLPERIIRVPVAVVKDAIRLLVQHPREFALLFFMWALLAAPVYLGARRRAFARAVTA